MVRFAWATALATLLVLALNLNVLVSALKTTTCAQLELEFDSEDFEQSLPDAPALVIGNQRVRYWDLASSPFEAQTYLHRSASGLNPPLIDRCFTRLVGFYQPSLVVVPIDTTYAAMVNQSELLTALQGIIDQRDGYSLNFDLWVIAPITTPRFELTSRTLLEEIRAAGVQWAENKFKVQWIDLQDDFLDEADAADPKLVWPDGNTLNEAGYQRLTDALVAISNERK